MSDFARALRLPTQMEFMAVSSYGSSTSSSGVVRILKDLDRDISDRHVLVLEDIIDSGLTLSWLLKNLGGRRPASLEVCALLRKPDAIKVEVPVRYVGFDIPNEFVDRKSTRLNSSHANISYAVFCLKKKHNTIVSWSRQVSQSRHRSYARRQAGVQSRGC